MPITDKDTNYVKMLGGYIAISLVAFKFELNINLTSGAELSRLSWY